MSVDMNMIKVGPAGGLGGTVWEEKGKGQIAKIYLSYGEYQIYSLQFLFVENGNFVLSDRHGDAHNENFTTVVLYYQSEYLTWIKGSYDTNDLRSIIFGTNKGFYGPYGNMKTPSPANYKEFKFEIGDDRSFGGFHGTEYDSGIESIGVYVKPITSSMMKREEID
ncbi:inactive protein RESTRICTED TEV MOVEMENT 1-like [Nicotiana sylvestris]|uniref:Inactive protein RESTRICTED TEV MOVEMENT 1-like n=1 Tax=Nicotiana sylvestris TaxID=4096 RepID=A0A1U7V9F8_NICSY|nr:PREDICTED: inactive protein RESTRICTED TEV MOVEMENT 1-like [Nicotiana sylvestris]